MAPGLKRGRSSSSLPLRKSARPAEKAISSSLYLQTERGLSALLTDTTDSESLPALLIAARQRISEYQMQNRPFENIMQSSLNALLDYLPDSGLESMARDILQTNTDDDLYNVFHNIFTGLAKPSRFKLHFF